MLRTAAALVALALFAPAGRGADGKPNVVLVVADDLGCFELGCYGQTKIKTPHIDKLAEGGAKFTRFYAGSPVCAPSRCVLMTGKHSGHATVRNNVQAKKGEEGQFPIRAEDVTVTELLKARGYVAGAMGKWGLGMFDTPGSPLKHGFDLFYGYNCQAHAHSHYPTHIYRNDTRVDLKDNDGKTGKQYTHDLFEAEALAFIDANKAKPFFLYLPFTVPHVALQVPEDALAEYKGKLGDDPAYTGKGYQPHPAPRAGLRGDGHPHGPQRRPHRREVEGARAGEEHARPVHERQRADAQRRRGRLRVLRLGGPLARAEGERVRGRHPRAADRVHARDDQAGSEFDQPLYFPDVLADAVRVRRREGAGRHRRDQLPPLLVGGKQRGHDFLYWEFPGYGGQQAVIEGEWKAVRQNLGTGAVKTELYHLARDPSEKEDVAAKHPEGSRTT
jgi:arylsulfatase